MRVVRVGIIASAVLAVAALAWAQKTDFSGTWTLDTTASGEPAGGGGGGGRMGGGRGGAGLGQGATVKQTAETLTLERAMGGNQVVFTYKLDGSESKNTMMGRGGNEVEAVSVAKWDGPVLTITTRTDMGGQTFESTQRWSLAGNVLTVETTSARGTQKMVYKKS